MRVIGPAIALSCAVGALAWRAGAAADLLPAGVVLLAGSLVLLVVRVLQDRRRAAGSRARRAPGHRAGVSAGIVLLLCWAAAAAALRLSVAVDEKYWEQPRGATGGLLYVALGDSAAQGIGASGADHGYVALLAARLQATTGRPIRVINLSRSGARIEDVIQTQLPRLQQLHPDIVTVAIGGNDVRHYQGRVFAGQVSTLTRKLPPGTAIADVPYFMHGHWESNADEAARAVRHSALQHGLTVVPLHAALRRQGWSAMLTQTAADWFHPNDRGYRVWAQAFWDALSASPVCRPPAAVAMGGCPRLSAAP